MNEDGNPHIKNRDDESNSRLLGPYLPDNSCSGASAKSRRTKTIFSRSVLSTASRYSRNQGRAAPR